MSSEIIKRPILAVTMGDPSGVGPEISAMVLADLKIYGKCRPLIVGSPAVMERALTYTRHTELKINTISDVKDALFTHGVIDVFDVGTGNMLPEPGVVNAPAGDMAFRSIEKTIELAMAGEVDATVTNPINKEAINMAGHHYAGHTEIYAHYTNTSKYSMMLAHGDFRVIHVSTHVSLKKACELVTKDRVLNCIRIADMTCKNLGIEKPKIAVAGLNPHCGEAGMFGTEEIDEICPAVAAAREEGIDVDGPIAADTVFSKAIGGLYDTVVAMYHDQGHIPMKVKGFVFDPVKKEWGTVSGVNISCGLPIIRTSVDHGTAMGHAGKGNANSLSLHDAMEYAIKLAQNRW